MRHLRLGLLLVLIWVTLGQGGVTEFRGLNRLDMGLTTPMLSPSTALNAASLSAAISGIPATAPSVLVTPGAWTIDANLTVPVGVHLTIAPGALLTINATRCSIASRPTCSV